ncbi:MAG TPA: phage holin family protein [Casimicrobiaceae bacterium]|nr:phage holin family protein [Casimicrobiaceae bacterium]
MARPAYDAFPHATPASAIGRAPSGWSDRVRRLVQDVRQTAADHVELAVLEAQRASQVLVRSIAAAVAMSVLAATAWLGIVTAIVVWLAQEIPLPVALLIGAAACLVLAGGIGWWVKRHIPELMFTATLRQLRATAAREEEAEKDEDEEKDNKP